MSEKLKIHDSEIDRLKAIEEMRIAGHTLESIAKDFGITRERVRQILLKSDKKIDTEFLKEKNRIKELIEIHDYAVKNWDSVQMMSLEQLATKLNKSEEKVKSALSQLQLVYLVANEAKEYDQKFSDEDCLTALRIAQTYSFPLSAKSYTKLVKAGTLQGPSSPLILKRFGSWSNACKTAGVESGEPAREHYEKQFSDFEILRYVRKFMHEQEDANWSIERYLLWRKLKAKDAPSFALIRMRMSGWAEVRVQALNLALPEYNMVKFSKVNLNG